MILTLSIIAASTRLLSNWLVMNHRWEGWPLKFISMAIFAYFNVLFGLWGLHLLNVADLWVAITAMRRWKNETVRGR